MLPLGHGSLFQGKPGLIIAGPTAESIGAIYPPPGLTSWCPGPGPYSPAFRLCINRPAASPDPSRSSAVEHESVLGNSPFLFQVASGRTGQLTADHLPRQPGSHRGPHQDYRTLAPPFEIQAPALSTAATQPSIADASPATAQPTQEAKPVTPDCSCSPGSQASGAQPFQPAASSDVQPTMTPVLPLRHSWPLTGIGCEGSAGRMRTSYPGCPKHPKCKRAQHL